MKEYLKKLGRTKFQAFLLMTATNITSLIMVLNGSLNVDADVEKWMPAINLVIQLVVSAVYMIVEGSIDKANATSVSTVSSIEKSYHGE